MKIAVIALLLASTFAAKLTPRTKLPQAFDDAIVNKLAALGQTQESIQQFVPRVTVSQEFRFGQMTQAREFVKSQIPSLSEQVLTRFLQQIDMAEIGGYSPDATLQEVHYDNKYITYYHLNIIGTSQNSYRFVLVWRERAGPLGAKPFKYTELSNSFLGLPAGNPEVINNNNMNPELYKKLIKELLLAISKARGTSRQLAMSLGAEGEEPKPEGEKKEEGKGGGLADILGGAKNVIQGLADGYKSIVEAFKTVKKEELKEKITGEGFNEYSAKSRYLRSIGIPKSYWETYKQQFMQLTGIAKNPNVKPHIETLLKMADFIQDNAWNTNDLTFDITKGGTCSNFVCLTRFDSVIQKYHIMTTVVDGTFQLAPNVWIYSKYKSVAGGIVETTKIVARNMPRAMTEGDAKAINAMMLLTSINVMQENFGIPKTLPEFSEMTAGMFKK